MMDILMSETCWAHKKWNKIASDIKLVFYSSIITMLHGPINIRFLSYVRPFCISCFPFMSLFLSFRVLYFSLSLICSCLFLSPAVSHSLFISFIKGYYIILVDLFRITKCKFKRVETLYRNSKMRTEIRFEFSYYLFSLQKLLDCSSWSGKFVSRFKPEHLCYNEKMFSINFLLGHPVFLFRFQSLYEEE